MKTYQHLKDVDGWLTPDETKCLYDLAETAARENPNACIVEIGSYRGKSTIALALGLQGVGRVTAIDPHEGAKYGFSMADVPILEKNLKDFGVSHHVDMTIAKSSDVAKTWDQPIDVLWIDGDHEYAGVKADVDNWTPFVRKGGYVAMHDCGSDKWPGVQQALNELLQTGEWEYTYGVDSLRIVRRLTEPPIIQRTAEPLEAEKPVKAKRTKAAKV